MSPFLLLLLLGVANWFATTLVVESEIFRPLRDWVANRVDDRDEGWWYSAWSMIDYLLNCHMCAGTWVGLAMALVVPPLVDVPVAGWLLTALAIRGIGHLVLLVNNLGNAIAIRYEADIMRSLLKVKRDEPERRPASAR